MSQHRLNSGVRSYQKRPFLIHITDHPRILNYIVAVYLIIGVLGIIAAFT
jgi:hypothetical protein